MEMIPVPIFYTERLILKPLELSDAASYEKNFVDYDVISELSAQVPWPYPKGGVATYLAEYVIPKLGTTMWGWGLALQENPKETIGSILMWRTGRSENRGFWLAKRFWGQGLMTEAVAPTIDFAFNELGFEKLIFANALGNTKSRRVKEKTGARFIGVEPAKFVNPSYSEHELWELTKEDWLKFKKL